MSANYDVPAQTITVETEIKKSRFITWIAHASNKAEALLFIRRIRQQYPDATHHCTAYIAGSPQGVAAIAFDDDGEPSGTAGKPMLNVLMHKGIGEIVAVVVRYYGGIQLGASGLVRAYSGAVQSACEQLPLKQRIFLKQGWLSFEYGLEQSIRHCLDIHGVALLDYHYSEQVTLVIAVEDSKIAHLAQDIQELSRGQITIQWKDDVISTL